MPLFFGLAGLGISILTLLHFTRQAEEQRRRAERERRCEGWTLLADAELLEWAYSFLQGDLEDVEDNWLECLALELEERGHPDEATTVWKRMLQP
jgi:hypothetical protein